MGIDVWVSRAHASAVAEPGAEAATAGDVPGTGGEPADKAAGGAATDLTVLEAQVRECRRCSLHASRTQTVFGVGNASAQWMFVGEAPGAEEDRQGIPFVGRAGQLLSAMLAAIGLERDAVYIANVLKCRPPANRDPMGEEVVQCEPYLHRQVELVAPRIIVALGRFGAQSLLKTTQPIGKLRGACFKYRDTDIPLIVTYHPAYLLRSPLEKRKAWDDLLMARRILERP
ncbi:MAG: uracil-DNA glycosylase [Gammaproteobacteria bacterium]|nr:uracil-DNA glycosylase [Gammaproteobacteria bacterium]